VAKINPDLSSVETSHQTGSTHLTTRSFGPDISVISRTRQLGTWDQHAATIGKFDPTRISYMQKYFMSRTDTMIRLGLHYTKVPLINAPYHFESDDPQAAAFVDNAYRRIHVQLMLGMLTKLDMGFSALVKNFKQIDPPDWKYEDDNGNEKKVWTSKLQPVVWSAPDVLPPYGAQPVFDKATGRIFQGIKHPFLNLNGGTSSSGDQYDPDIPVEYALWVTNEKESVWGDWYGWPATAPAFRYWWSYWYRWLMGDRHFEADADPPIIVWGPADEKYPDPTDPSKQITSQELGLLIAESVRNGSSLFMPSDMYESEIDGRLSHSPKWKIDVLRNAENMKVFQESFDYSDTMKLRAMLVPEQALIQGQQGATGKSAAATYGQAFAESLGLQSGELDQAINDWLIPDLLAQNFVDAPPVRKVTTGFREEDLEAQKNLITILAQQDLQSLDLDVRKLVKSVGLPQISADRARKQREEQMGAGSNFDPNAGGDSGGTGPLPPGTPAAGTDTSAGAAAAAGAAGGATPAGQGGQPGGLQVVGFAIEVNDDFELPEGVPAYRDPEVQKIAAEMFAEIDTFLSGIYSDSVQMVEASAGGEATLLLDGSWSPDLHPRWPGKAAAGKGGEFMQVANILQRLGNSLSGSMNVGFLARGAKRIRGVQARRHGEGVSFDVTLGDGRKGSIIADANTDMSKIVDALRQVDDGTIKRQIADAEHAAKEDARQAKKDAVRDPIREAAKGMTGPPDPEKAAKDNLGVKEINALVDQAENDPKLSTWPPPKGDVGRQVLGDYHSTRDLWTDRNGKYSPDRKELHDRIITSFLGEHKRQQEQTVLFTAGGPASGKSTGGGTNPDGDILPPDAVKVDVDLIRTWLPEYRMMRAERDQQGNIIKHGDPAIASATHDEATDIARELTRQALEGRLNIVVDGTGNTAPGVFGGKHKRFKDAGYRVEVALFDVPTDKAVQRAVVRAHRTDRFLPPKFVRKKHEGVATAHLVWRDSEDVDQWRAYSTDVAKGEQVIKMAEGGAGAEPTIHDPERYKAFTEKARKPVVSKSKADYDSYKPPKWLKGDSGSGFGSGPAFGGGGAAGQTSALGDPLEFASPGDFKPGDAVYSANGDYLGSFYGVDANGDIVYLDAGVKRTVKNDAEVQRRSK
jgi:hypothetical protein